MKRLLCFICALVCALTLASCQNEETETTVQTDTEATDTTEYESEPVELTEDMIDTIMAWREAEAWDITSTSMMSMVDDGDSETAQGYYLGFDGCMIKGENGNMYKGDTIAMNSAFPIELTYEMYYYDGWGYQIYRDATVEELNTYERYQTTEAQFLSAFDGIVPTFASEEEFKSGSASVSGDTTVVSVTLGDGRARDELIGDVESIAEYNGVSVDDITVNNAAVSYAIEDGKLIGYIGSFELSFYVDGVHRVYSLEKSAQINAVDGDVESFTLPEGYESFDDITYGYN